MSIFAIVLLIFAVVILVIIIAGVPVSQRAINILLLIMIILLAISESGWLSGIKVVR